MIDIGWDNPAFLRETQRRTLWNKSTNWCFVEVTWHFKASFQEAEWYLFANGTTVFTCGTAPVFEAPRPLWPPKREADALLVRSGVVQTDICYQDISWQGQTAVMLGIAGRSKMQPLVAQHLSFEKTWPWNTKRMWHIYINILFGAGVGYWVAWAVLGCVYLSVRLASPAVLLYIFFNCVFTCLNRQS